MALSFSVAFLVLVFVFFFKEFLSDLQYWKILFQSDVVFAW